MICFLPMSIKKFLVFSYGCLLLLTTSSCYSVFPLTNTVSYEQCDAATQNIHDILKTLVIIKGMRSQTKAVGNHFTCAFNFITESGVEEKAEMRKKIFPHPLIEYRSRQESLNLKSHPKGSQTKSIGVQRKYVTRKIRKYPIYLTKDLVGKFGTPKDFISKIQFTQKVNSQQKSNPHDIFIFKTYQPRSTQTHQQKSSYMTITKLHKDFYTFSKGDKRDVRLTAANLWTINERSTSQAKNYSLVNTDSEMNAIVVLQDKKVTNAICNKLISKLQKDEYVIGIEFHGCTTNDMCSLCSTNFSILQYLAMSPNEKASQASFLGALKHRLFQASKARTPFSITTVISSFVEYPDGGNPLWEPISEGGIKRGCVNQFRFEERSTNSTTSSQKDNGKKEIFLNLQPNVKK
jgi:hypothetical protein